MNTGPGCPKCGAPVAAGEQFCASCGYQLQAGAAEQRDVGRRIGIRYAKQTYQGKMRGGRTAIMVVAILTVLATVVLHFMAKSEFEKADREIADAKGNPMYDQDLVREAETDLKKARGVANLIVGGHAILALAYFGLWFWAKTKPLPANLSALILFLAVQAVGAAIEPESLARGFIIKILILAALIGSINAAARQKKLAEAGL